MIRDHRRWSLLGAAASGCSVQLARVDTGRPELQAVPLSVYKTPWYAQRLLFSNAASHHDDVRGVAQLTLYAPNEPSSPSANLIRRIGSCASDLGRSSARRRGDAGQSLGCLGRCLGGLLLHGAGSFGRGRRIAEARAADGEGRLPQHLAGCCERHCDGFQARIGDGVDGSRRPGVGGWELRCQISHFSGQASTRTDRVGGFRMPHETLDSILSITRCFRFVRPGCYGLLQSEIACM